jgi:hypothetical protein
MPDSLYYSSFLRRNSLNDGERHVNYKQIDNDVIEALTSEKARHVSTLVAHVYLRLLGASRNRIARFKGTERADGKRLTAWEELLDLLEVAPATAHKILIFLHEQSIIGLTRDRDDANITIFINYAAASVQATNHSQEVYASESRS